MWVHLYICGYVEKYHIYSLKVGVALYMWVCIIRGYLQKMLSECSEYRF